MHIYADTTCTFPWNCCSYVDRKKVLGGDEAAYEYRWGSRAEKELTKRQVLHFVSEVRWHNPVN